MFLNCAVVSVRSAVFLYSFLCCSQSSSYWSVRNTWSLQPQSFVIRIWSLLITCFVVAIVLSSLIALWFKIVTAHIHRIRIHVFTAAFYFRQNLCVLPVKTILADFFFGFITTVHLMFFVVTFNFSSHCLSSYRLLVIHLIITCVS